MLAERSAGRGWSARPRGHRPYCGLNGRLSVQARHDRQRVASENRRVLIATEK